MMEMNGKENVDKISLRLFSQFSHENLKASNVDGKFGRKSYICFVNISL